MLKVSESTAMASSGIASTRAERHAVVAQPIELARRDGKEAGTEPGLHQGFFQSA